MIFSSYPFILVFLPAVVASTLLLRRYSREQYTVLLLTGASLFFYGYWDWHFVWVILLSIAINYAIGVFVGQASSVRRRKWMLAAGVTFNLGFLGYFKYTNFFIENVSALFGAEIPAFDTVLPLGISFFTFQQIAYLVDVYRREAIEHDFRHYLLFVTFFPQLIAGPIVHHKEMMPQFMHGWAGRIDIGMAAQGVAVFILGVAKKILIADAIARYSTPVFEASAASVRIPLIEAWGGALAYTFQIYFDFSAYSDMAIGLGLIFGLRLPINFNSPYKATSIIEFWRRWHMTLSRFLRDYLYIPLGGNRKGGNRRLVNVMVVMLLGGLWHGAAWTFVIWGALHGVGLVVNHLWRQYRWAGRPVGLAGVVFGWTATFLFVVVTWVFFRAENVNAALNILSGMVGANGVVLSDTYLAHLGPIGAVLVDAGVRFEAVHLFQGVQQVEWILAVLVAVILLPNSLEWAGYDPRGEMPRGRNGAGWLYWRPNIPWAWVLSVATVVSLVMMSDAGEFLYFQF